MFAATKLASGVLNDFLGYADIGVTGIKQLYWFPNHDQITYVANSSGVTEVRFPNIATNSLSGSFVNDSFSLSNCTGAFFRDSGTTVYLYTLDTTSNKVKEYTTTSGILNTATATGKEFSVATQTTSGFNLFFSDDGTVMIVQSSSNVYKYTLSTAWNITTASLSSTTSHSNLISIYDTSGNKTSGYLYAAAAGTINRYDVSPTYTISFSSLSKQITAKELTGGTSSVICAKSSTILAGNSDGKIYLFGA